MFLTFDKGRNVTQYHLQTIFFHLGGFCAKLVNILFLFVQHVKEVSLPVEVSLEITPVSAII